MAHDFDGCLSNVERGGRPRRGSFLTGTFFLGKIFSKFPKFSKSLLGFSKKFSRTFKKDFFPNFYDSFSVATQVVFLRKKKRPKK
jgi:hypothetical protein